MCRGKDKIPAWPQARARSPIQRRGNFVIRVRMAADFLGYPPWVGRRPHIAADQNLPSRPDGRQISRMPEGTGAESHPTEHQICHSRPDGHKKHSDAAGPVRSPTKRSTCFLHKPNASTAFQKKKIEDSSAPGGSILLIDVRGSAPSRSCQRR